jgi:antitoxin YefM
MIVISSKEFRDNQKKYLDMADQNQQVIVQRGKVKSYALVPISEKDKYFMDSDILADIKEGLKQYKEGNTVRVNKSDIGKLLGL